MLKKYQTLIQKSMNYAKTKLKYWLMLVGLSMTVVGCSTQPVVNPVNQKTELPLEVPAELKNKPTVVDSQALLKKLYKSTSKEQKN